MGMDRKLTNADLAGREKLEDRIDATITKGKIYFCRLSTRSPKDGVSLSAEDKMLPITERLNKKIILLQVTNGEQVVELISKSQRVFSDINFYFQYRTLGASSGQLCLILRAWIENIPQDHEFRCYAVDKKLTAISQYQCYCVFPALQNEEHVKKIREAILKFHDTIKEHIPLNDYVVDFIVFPDYSVNIIEFNPMGPSLSSGSALFNWEKDLDLLMGRAKFDFVP